MKFYFLAEVTKGKGSWYRTYVLVDGEIKE